MAVVSSQDSMRLEEITPPFVFPHGATGSGGTRPGDSKPIVRIGDWAVGARFDVEPEPPGCRVECTVVHADCFRVFTACGGHGQDALEHLWFLGLWRQPWNRTKTLQGARPLPREKFLCSKAGIRYVLEKMGMRDFATRLPWEIVSDIFEFSRDALLWRVARAATVAFERSEYVADQCTVISALEIASWKRGDSSPETIGPSTPATQLTRFAIDSQGISRIQRIEKSSSFLPGYLAHDHEYIVADEEELQSVAVIFRSGRARICIPDGHQGFTTWDLMNPPPNPLRPASLHDDISDWVDNGASSTRMCGQMVPANRFQTAHLGGATGLTFIFHSHFLAHIHAHTPKYPIARLPHDTCVFKEIGGPPMEEFSDLAWIYLPLPAGDKILSIAFGTDGRTQRIQQPGMMIKTKLAGTVFIGYLMPISSPCILLGEEPELLFTRLQAPFVSGVGAYSSNPVSKLQYSDEVRSFPREMAFAQPEPFRLTSYAPLDNVVRLDVVEEPTNGALRGLMLHYANGAQRVVGQYRIGQHQLKTYMEPKCLCLRSERPQGGGMMVPPLLRATASHSCEGGHEAHTRSRGRACYPLSGFVRAQFDFDSISFRFADHDFKLVDAMEGAVPALPIFQSA
ncbi:hypothetical protein V2A60_002998 [Cordyceps javanica]|uniref:Uncharacterized protein n=1 Tax=Cordyceps javanica TaxID=43265 RepID=A0A545V4G6_9HYPO|nr:hypothetical protein IF1G_05198 [Cordyceps javanica]TQW07890.1 hypothetical protein IF2G_05051 [Cordyceps javanica]